MNDKELNELLEYNREYMDARLSEDVFGGDYTSEVELKYLEKDYIKLQNRIKELEQINEEHRKLNGQLMSNWDSLREWLEKVVKLTANIDEKMTCKNALDKMNKLEGEDKE